MSIDCAPPLKKQFDFLHVGLLSSSLFDETYFILIGRVFVPTAETRIQSELSLAYLAAVASQAGMDFVRASPIGDDRGTDVYITSYDDYGPSYQDSTTLHIQVKSTKVQPSESSGAFSYALRLIDYERLRKASYSSHGLLMVLFMPIDVSEWLFHSHDELAFRRCMYWVSLRKADAANVGPNTDHKTVYIPRQNCVSVDGLRNLMQRVANWEDLRYEHPRH